MAKPKIRTSINISRPLLNDIRMSGIRNMSKYVEDLVKADLYNVKKLSVQEQAQLTSLQKELAKWRAEWTAYVKESERAA